MTTTSIPIGPPSAPPSSSSLAPVLAGLGHDCPGFCGAAADELGASVWFVRRRPAGDGRTESTLVVLDASEYTGPLRRSRQLMRDLNDCVRQDGIRVTERRIDDSGRALATVSFLRRDGSLPVQHPGFTPTSPTLS
jgi:hypothetical protein